MPTAAAAVKFNDARDITCRFIVADIVANKQYVDEVAEGNFSFLRSNAAYKHGIDFAYKRWKWIQKRLNR